jgi:hypothetical protein
VVSLFRILRDLSQYAWRPIFETDYEHFLHNGRVYVDYFPSSYTKLNSIQTTYLSADSLGSVLDLLENISNLNEFHFQNLFTESNFEFEFNRFCAKLITSLKVNSNKLRLFLNNVLVNVNHPSLDIAKLMNEKSHQFDQFRIKLF